MAASDGTLRAVEEQHHKLQVTIDVASKTIRHWQHKSQSMRSGNLHLTNRAFAHDMREIQELMERAAEAIRMYRQQLEVVISTIETTPAEVQRLQETIDIDTQTVRRYRRQLDPMAVEWIDADVQHIHLIAQQLAAAIAPESLQMVSLTDSLVSTTPPRIDWPPFGQFALRVLLATIMIGLIRLVWEEGMNNAPVATLSAIASLVAAWQQFDQSIGKDR